MEDSLSYLHTLGALGNKVERDKERERRASETNAKQLTLSPAQFLVLFPEPQDIGYQDIRPGGAAHVGFPVILGVMRERSPLLTWV